MRILALRETYKIREWANEKSFNWQWPGNQHCQPENVRSASIDKLFKDTTALLAVSENKKAISVYQLLRKYE